jgi:hypothetical protein
MKRHWCVTEIDDVDEIAEQLAGARTWVLCNGIRWRGLLILNDATSEDGGQEYAVIDEKSGAQLESLTCSWMTKARLAATLKELASGSSNGKPMVQAWPEGQDPRERIETPEQHKRRYCALCA